MNLLTFTAAVLLTTTFGAGCWKLVELLLKFTAWILGACTRFIATYAA